MFNILLVVIVLHLAAILFYTFVRRDRLVGADDHRRPRRRGGRGADGRRRRCGASCLPPALALGVTLWIASGL